MNNSMKENLKIKYVKPSKKDMERADELEKQFKYCPHVVILGAGASKANIINGDKNGLQIPCMDDFFGIDYFSDLLDGIYLQTKSKNLENIYSEIYKRSLRSKKYEDVKCKLEERIRDYFCKFESPHEPTIYDYLIMSLTNKDLIASFNWDPMLVQSYIRIRKLFGSLDNMPRIAFLHGNVGIEVDTGTKRINIKTTPYDKCFPGFSNLKLLYPTRQKNYSSDAFIKNQWDMVRNYVGRAYFFTIFGYGAPSSDSDAMNLLKEAWGDTSKKWANEIEIINVEDPSICYEKWKPFIYGSHYQCHKDFFESFIATHPRRTTESLFDVTMNVIWGKPTKILNQKPSLEEFHCFLKPLIDDEVLKKDKKIARTNIYSTIITPIKH